MTKLTRVALFIDAENASPKHLSRYIEFCEKKGTLAIKHCYGTQTGLTSWEEFMKEHHVRPIMTPPGATIKSNATDFALTIDAVSLLHRGMFDCAVIASSDSDFIQLACHIREHGKPVHGLGEAKATEALRSAFDSYQVIEEPQKPAPKSAAVKSLDIEWVMKKFRELSQDGKSIERMKFVKALADDRKDYRKGFRTADKFLEATRRFTVKDTTVFLLSRKN